MIKSILATRSSIFFNYDEMTWDAVADLPRDTPLVLPLGSGYNLDLLADELSNPPRIGLLPAFPFGWRGSGLAARTNFLSIHNQPVRRLARRWIYAVYCLAPQGFDPQSSFVGGHSAFLLRQPNPSQNAEPMFLPQDSERGK